MVGETAEDVRAALLRNHPELTEAKIDALLIGAPARRRRVYRPDSLWVDNRGRREVRGIRAGRTKSARVTRLWLVAAAAALTLALQACACIGDDVPLDSTCDDPDQCPSRGEAVVTGRPGAAFLAMGIDTEASA